MAIEHFKNSLLHVARAPGLRCDTHHIQYYTKWESFYAPLRKIAWVSLESLVESIRNGINLTTEYYSIEQTDFVYLSVSQISPYGFEKKNVTYLREDVEDLPNYYAADPRMLFLTRSGTVGVAMSGDHPSLDANHTYVPSGFVITARLRSDVKVQPRTLTGYLNIPSVQALIISLAAGGNQKNISQEVFNRIPVPVDLVSTRNNRLSETIEKFNLTADKFRQAREKIERDIEDAEERLSREFERVLSGSRAKR